ncbi:sialate O-acetylesterase [Sunxiuqinia sp. sy24]|uniref:sialate O-acetylesterase n=1 Tax=Sunxiuqinia sp. sy24 TaxID=3461495 RepID=UPI0040453C74
MKKTPKIIVITLLLLVSTLRSSISNQTQENEWHIFLLMGQSNMAGYGELLPQDTIPVKGIYKIPTIGTGDFVWEPAAHPLHNRLKSDRFSLGLPFAKQYMKDHPNVKVGLIPVAWGGAGIDRLKKGTDTYNDALAKAEFAQKKGKIKGILWHQGESDSITEELAEGYEGKLHQLIADLRADLNIPDLPFIVGNLAEFYGTSEEHNTPERARRINQVKSVLRSLPEKVENTGFVESSGCTSIDHHNVHFDRQSYITLGERYAAQYKKITK